MTKYIENFIYFNQKNVLTLHLIQLFLCFTWVTSMSTTCKNTCSDGCKNCKKKENFSKFKRSLNSEKSIPLNISSYFFFKSYSYSHPSFPLSPREKNLGAGFFKDRYRRDNSAINEITKGFWKCLLKTTWKTLDSLIYKHVWVKKKSLEAQRIWILLFWILFLRIQIIRLVKWEVEPWF